MVTRRCLLLLAPALALLGCESRVGTLSIDCRRSWDWTQEPLERLARYVRLRVDGPDLLVGPERVEYETGRASLEIPVGERRQVTVEGLGPEESVVSRGRSAPLTIREGANALSLYLGTVGKEGEFSFATSRLRGARAFHAATLLEDGSVLLSGGTDNDWRPDANLTPAPLRSVERIDGSALLSLPDHPACNGEDQSGCMVAARIGHTATLLASGNVLIAGGTSGQTTAERLEIYEPDKRTLFTSLPLGTPRAWHAALLTDRGVALVGGVDASQRLLAASETYDGKGLKGFPGLRQPRRAFTLTTLGDGTLLVAGGLDESDRPTSTTELLSPGSPSWQEGPALSAPRAYHSATPLADGGVLFAGGLSGDDQAAATLDRLDPASREIRPLAGALFRARWAHTATQLADGRVLVVGGFGAGKNGSPMEAVESLQLFEGDPGMVHVKLLANLRDARAGHTATLLPSGFVLVTGGLGTLREGSTLKTVALDTAEVFVY